MCSIKGLLWSLTMPCLLRSYLPKGKHQEASLSKSKHPEVKSQWTWQSLDNTWEVHIAFSCNNLFQKWQVFSAGYQHWGLVCLFFGMNPEWDMFTAFHQVSRQPILSASYWIWLPLNIMIPSSEGLDWEVFMGSGKLPPTESTGWYNNLWLHCFFPFTKVKTKPKNYDCPPNFSLLLCATVISLLELNIWT